MTWIPFPAFALLALAACAAAPPVREGAPPLAEDACGATALQDLLGQDSRVLAGMTFPELVRIYDTGDALTLDFNPERLNIEIGPDGRIVAVTCG